MDPLKWLQDWYEQRCDGDWEHQQGVKIETLDNPGWRLTIDLIGTKQEGLTFSKVKTERTETDWLHCWVKDEKFHAAGGPGNLGEMISTFQTWVLHNH